ncbi:glycoside hydrolase family 2 TIM barrel-domain containing protein [Pedobacter sp. JY14-1]|uniref:glycoside hydrolase family 2 TIM barrel-domain containing protein n=1 Tax=Pedobacter sp. JY14-1 TaxID=3034151 RepID=UPI0023E1B1FE|nr:glycoside hydrolase family 2 TIM barrel-domain containing protein [Pedobacter sp. JY14-1]
MSRILLLLLCLFSLSVSGQLKSRSNDPGPAASSIVRYLSGTGADHTVSWDFYCTGGMGSGKWTKIQVPSCWEQQGFGEYNYGHMPLDKRVNEEGHYKYAFNLNPDWKGRHVRLVFEGVLTDCEVKLNGKPAGRHQGGFYEFDLDVSGLLRYDAVNQLEVNVKKRSDNKSVNQAELEADFWNFGGIFRPVYLQADPAEYIDHVAVDARADGTFFADVTTSDRRAAARIQVEIRDMQGRQIAVSGKAPGSSPTTRISGKAPSVKTWSPEFPNRYVAVTSLLGVNGKLIHQVRHKIGFRTVEVRAEDGIYVNGVKIKFKGVNAHTFHPDYGRTSSEKMSVETVNLIKDMNMNAVRFSHYPHDKHFLNACDSLGLFVLDELTGWQAPSYDDTIGRKLVRELIRRDVNAPSVVFWDNGNEGGWNYGYDHEFGELDIQKREVLHPWETFGKTNTAHYITYDYLSMQNFASRQIFFPTEFLHGLYDGGLGAGLEDYWEKMWAQPLCAGGFLWVLADEMVKRTDSKELDGDGNHAPDGIVGPYHEREGSFYTIREIWSPVYIGDKYITPAFDGNFPVENRFHYTRFGQCKFSYRWLRLPAPGGGVSKTIASGVPQLGDLGPTERGNLKVGLPAGWQQADVLEITATDPHGRLVCIRSFPVRTPSNVTTDALKAVNPVAVVSFSEGNGYEFSVGEIRIHIDKTNGMLRSVSNRKGQLPLQNGPVLASGSYTVSGVRHEEKEGIHQVVVDYEKNRMQAVWTIRPDGLVELQVKYQPKGSGTFAGLEFSLPEKEVEGVRWMGDGPYRVWKNRLRGVNFNIWEKAYNNTVTGHSGFVYPEFKGYHANLYWAKLLLKGGQSFTVYNRTPDVFLKLFNPGEAPGPENSVIANPPGDLSFMHAIPAIGNKFSKPDALGPRSAPYSFDSKRVPGGYLKLDLVFDFSGK